jgi:branched-chain amino acid transport system ATP-binding protein
VVRQGEIVALVGANGAGKSTLLRTVSGLLQPAAGSILFDGAPIGGRRADQIVDLGLLHVAEGRRIFRRQTVRANLELSLYGTRLPREEEQRRFDQVFSLFPILEERRETCAGVLSGGQQQMLTIAQALMRAPRLLMLDEPSLGLAPIVVDQVLDTVETLARNGITILLVEQMVELALEIADHAYIMQHGHIIGHGPAAEIANSPLLKKAYLGSAAS